MLVPKGSPSEIRIRPQVPSLSEGDILSSPSQRGDIFGEQIFEEDGISFVLNWCMIHFYQDVK